MKPPRIAGAYASNVSTYRSSASAAIVFRGLGNENQYPRRRPIMKRVHIPLLVSVVCVCALMLLAAAPPPAGDDAAMKLAHDVMKATGGDNFSKVKRIQFTFNVIDKDGKPAMAAKHDWDVRAGTDTVTWKDKTVTVKL